MLPDDTLMWHYEDLEVVPIVLLRSLCKFLALEYRLSDKHLEKAWNRASEASPLHFEDAKEFAMARGHTKKSSSSDSSAAGANTDAEVGEKSIEEMVQEELEKIQAKDRGEAQEEETEGNDKKEEEGEDEGWPPLPLPDSNQALLGAASDEDLKPGSVW